MVINHKKIRYIEKKFTSLPAVISDSFLGHNYTKKVILVGDFNLPHINWSDGTGGINNR